MPIYYGETRFPPPFKRMMPGCVGYYGPAGQIVMYGKDPKIKEMIDAAMTAKQSDFQRGLDVELIGREMAPLKLPAWTNPIRHKIKRKSRKAPKQKPAPKPAPVVSKKPKPQPPDFYRIGRDFYIGPMAVGRHFWICHICGELCRCTKHHITPRQMIAMALAVVEDVEHPSNFARLCSECHFSLHRKYSNHELANMHWPDVIEAMQKQSSL